MLATSSKLSVSIFQKAASLFFQHKLCKKHGGNINEDCVFFTHV